MTPPTARIDLEAGWEVSPSVSLRRESFGALVYDFRTRRLSFLKSPKLLGLLESLGEQPTGTAALAAAGITEAERPAYLRALQTLAQTAVIVPREAGP